jgi:hypothetical protein
MLEANMELEKNDFFTLFESDKCIFIKVSKPGFDIKSFDKVFARQSQIVITKFLDLKKALDFGTKEPVQVGVFVPMINVSISSDDLKAYLILNITEEQIENDRAKPATPIIPAK